jgi:predicted nuclease of restriction endonuclease-like (RecB) superfamily
VPEEQARGHYENESLRGGGPVSELDRQIVSRAYESSSWKEDKADFPRQTGPPRTTKSEIRLELEFLDLKDENQFGSRERARQRAGTNSVWNWGAISRLSRPKGANKREALRIG